MAFSGNISVATFNALAVIDQSFRRCRLPAQKITAEMHSYALNSLYLLLSELANTKTPSWCIEKIILPMYENQPAVSLPLGTVSVLNANYRSLQEVTGGTIAATQSYTVAFDSDTVVSTVGVKWGIGGAIPITLQASSDGASWATVGTSTVSSNAGEITWTDISGAMAYHHFRITTPTAFNYTWILLGNTPQEIPFGVLNRDTYSNQNNKTFPGRPNSFWFQRDIPQPVMNLWPAPNVAAESAQLVVWRHRHIMDTNNLQQEVEVPQRWLEAIVCGLASKVGQETPEVELKLLPLLASNYQIALQLVKDGDNDGSPTWINPGIGCYTR
jgi:hypothetical protein